MLAVEAGGAIENVFDEAGAEGCVAGVADWKSSKSSSSPVVSSTFRPLLAGCLPAAVEAVVVGAGSSSPKSKRSGTGAGSGFFGSRLVLVAGSRRGGLISPSSYSSYSSKRLPLRPVS